MLTHRAVQEGIGLLPGVKTAEIPTLCPELIPCYQEDIVISEDQKLVGTEEQALAPRMITKPFGSSIDPQHIELIPMLCQDLEKEFVEKRDP